MISLFWLQLFEIPSLRLSQLCSMWSQCSGCIVIQFSIFANGDSFCLDLSCLCQPIWLDPLIFSNADLFKSFVYLCNDKYAYYLNDEKCVVEVLTLIVEDENTRAGNETTKRLDVDNCSVVRGPRQSSFLASTPLISFDLSWKCTVYNECIQQTHSWPIWE